MGREVQCVVRHGGGSAEVKALLETEAVILRGEIKATIPFAGLSRVEAVDGVLHLDDTSLDLGPQAAKWADKILHPPTLLDKLGIKPGMRVALFGFDDASFLAGHPFESSATGKECDAILYRAPTLAELSALGQIAHAVCEKTVLWIVYPKGRQDIKESDVFAHGKAVGLVDVKVCKFSETETALKFVRRKS
ncbi:MAG TPA: hypothetical protein VHE55_02665 [Fimbriimonadaceae bacterium]|nr:hypothetical protein [Fimbriimonadaceae bacterium]